LLIINKKTRQIWTVFGLIKGILRTNVESLIAKLVHWYWMVNCLSRSSKAHWIVLVIFILIGFIFGTILGQILKPYFPFLAVGASASMAPQTFNLAHSFSLTFGIKISLNLATIIGVALAFFIFRRL
jgi:hypothetical protein